MTDTLVLQSPRLFASSSSRKMEGLSEASGLPPQASIAGSLCAHKRPLQWDALVEDLGEQSSKVESTSWCMGLASDEVFVQELAEELLRYTPIGTSPSAPCGCAFIATCGPSPWSHRAVALVPVHSLGVETDDSQLEDQTHFTGLTADTDDTYTVEQMARAWRTIARGITQSGAELSADPDDYPLF